MKNESSIGLATIIPLALVLGAVAVFVWRLIAGDTPEDASAYVMAIIAVVGGIAIAVLRQWRAVQADRGQAEIVAAGQGSASQDGVGVAPEDTVPVAPADAD